MNAAPDRPYAVVVDGATHRTWGRYATQGEAQAACAALLRHGLVARSVNEQDEQPEHRGKRRAFLIWACMLGVVPPQRVVERIVAEVEREAAL